MLHRDVKPGNILLREDGQAVLADFGIARILSTTQFTATGSLIGTPAYMSPEQGQGASLTPASDLYSLGVIVYEMLTNNVPFEAETPLATIHQQVYDPLPALSTYRKDLPPPLMEVVERALQKDPLERFPSAGDFSDAFQRAASGAEVEGQDHAVAVIDSEDPEVLKETVVMEDEILEETAVMEESLPADDEAVVELEAAPPDSILEIPSGKEEHKKFVEAAELPWRKYLPALLVGAAVIAVVVIGALSGWFSGGTPACGDIGECVGMAESALQNGDFDDAVSLFGAALDQVSADEQPTFAELWCRRGDALVAMDHFDDAIGSFETCAAWTQGLPELEGLRSEAQSRVDELLSQ
jgi:hypothetical protein